MKENLPEIKSREDLKTFLSEFYNNAQNDDVIGEKFKDLNMDEHIEVIADFWDSILFGSNSYKGDPFGKHIPMKLEDQHFTRWVEIFVQTADEMYTGDIVEEMKTRGKTIAQVFQHKLT
jgi:hemoglobin